ncbi:TniQ family protein [Paraburkholderia franconis]|nr:TniQ family protein [Paraburkholderia franconis]
MQSHNASLPVRPRRRPDEWTESYLGRVARAMGVKRPWRNDLDVLRRLLFPDPPSAAEGVPQYGHLPSPGWAVAGRAAKVRYCPACMAEAKYIRARWRMPYMEVCTVHHIRLKDDLVEPAFTGNYARPGRYVICDATVEQLWEGAVCPIYDELDHVMELWRPFEKAVVAGDEERAAEHLGWTLLVERLLDALATSIRGIDYPPKDIARLAHRASWSKKFGLSATPTKEAVVAMLDGLRLPAHRRAALRFLAYQIKEESRRRTCLSSLPLQTLHDRLMAAHPESLRIRGFGALPKPAHPAGHLSLEAAEATIGCPPGMLYELVRKGAFSNVQCIEHGRKRYKFIRYDEVLACRRWFSSLMSIDEILAHFGIDRVGYWFLLRMGILRPQNIACRAWFHRCDAQAFLAKLEDVSCAISDQSAHLFPLSHLWANRRGCSDGAFKDAFVDLVSGRRRLYKKLGEPGLSAFFLDAETLEGVRRASAAYKARALRALIVDRQLTLELPG